MSRNPVVRFLVLAGSVVVGLATVLGTLAAFGVKAADLADALWPAGVVILLSVALIVVCAAWYAQQRGQGGRVVSSEDQRLLDNLLRTMSRRRMRELQVHDFGISWPEDLVVPAERFRHGFGDVEHRFADQKLERARASLYDAADAFLDAEASNGFTHEHRDDRRNVGWTSSEVEGMPEEYRIFEERRRAILGAAQAFRAAHDRFVAVAKQQGFDISAVAGNEPSSA